MADRLLLVQTMSDFYGDDIAAVVAENEVAAAPGSTRNLKAEYEELPFVLDVQKAMEDGALRSSMKSTRDNVLAHTSIRNGDYENAAVREPGLTKVEGWYETPTVQHCHIENSGLLRLYGTGADRSRDIYPASPYLPPSGRWQALGIPWGQVRVIKPYIGGGFGNKQDILYEPLCAYLCTVRWAAGL